MKVYRTQEKEKKEKAVMVEIRNAGRKTCEVYSDRMENRVMKLIFMDHDNEALLLPGETAQGVRRKNEKE